MIDVDEKVIGWICTTSPTCKKYHADIFVCSSNGRAILRSFRSSPDSEEIFAELTKENAQSLISFLNAAIDEIDKS